MMRRLIGAAYIAVGFGLTATAAVAHHSSAMFDSAHLQTMTGTVRLFQWTNPHSYIQLVVKNANGQDEEWSIEMGSPLHLMENGWGKFTVKPGDKIKVTIAPLRRGDKGGQYQNGTRIDGSPLGKTT